MYSTYRKSRGAHRLVARSGCRWPRFWRSGSRGSIAGPWCSISDRVAPVRGVARRAAARTRLCRRRGRRRAPASRRERLGEVDVLGHRVGPSVDRHARAGHDQRHVDVGVERRQLARHQPVLAGVQAVVGAEHDVGVAGEAVRGQRLPRLGRSCRSTACTDCARCRKARLICAICAGSERRVAREPARRVGRERVEVRRPRRRQRRGTSCASRGAGVYGACGANVASSRKNGWRRARRRSMNSTPLRGEHVGQVVRAADGRSRRIRPFSFIV